MSVNFWNGGRQSKPVAFGDKREIVDKIIELSDAMPDPKAHRLWLLGLDECVLKERLRIIQSESNKNLYRNKSYASEMSRAACLAATSQGDGLPVEPGPVKDLARVEAQKLTAAACA